MNEEHRGQREGEESEAREHRSSKEEANEQVQSQETVEGTTKEVPATDEDLPVIARMVVEIRSDGSRTIARGALEDVEKKDKIAIRAEGASPLALAGSLARALTQLPRISKALSDAPRNAGRAVRALIAGYKGPERD